MVLELTSRIAFVDGCRVDLSPKEFELLTELAAHPGEPIRTEELIRSVWPESFGMTSQEVRWHIWRLRQAIGDDKRESRIVANRRGFGYLVDLEPEEIQFVDGQTLLSENDTGESAASDGRRHRPLTLEQSVPRGRKMTILLSAGSVLLLLTGTWVASSRFSGRSSPARPPTSSEEANQPQPKLAANSGDKNITSNGVDGKRTARRGLDRSAPGSTKGAFSSGPVVSSVGGSDTEQSRTVRQGRGNNKQNTHAANKQEEPSAPEPNAELFHLHDPETGEHFLTMSSSTANQKQAAGYELVVEGGVFTDSVKGTLAIALDDGTAYIFKDSSPETVDGTTVAPLYRLEKDGEFFYTSSSSTANQGEAQGWARTVVGYVAT